MVETTRKKLSVVTPVYFNAESLPILAEELRWLESELHSREIDLELIFIDDGSGDHSLEELLKIKATRPSTKVISLTRNFGAVAASKLGFKYVTGDAFLILSADLQEPPEQVLLMVDEWRAGQKFVVSVRKARRDPLLSRILAWFYHSMLKLMVARDYPYGGFDLFLMDNAMLPYMQCSAKRTNPMLYAWWLGLNPKILYYTRLKRRYGTSRYTLRKKLALFVDSFTGFSATPIRMLSALGVCVAFLSFLYGTSIILSEIFFVGVTVPGFASIAVLISFFSGLILVMLGIIGEYIWRILDAVNNQPESVIDKLYL